jgi:putative membrane protein
MNSESKGQQNRDLDKKKEVSDKTDLILTAALVRTMLAAENSLMAWIRTSISLFAFGFSMITFFDYLSKKEEGIQSIKIIIIIGFALISVGIISLILAMVEHKYIRDKLLELGLPKISRFSIPLRTALALNIIAIISLIVILFNISIYII